MEIIKIDSKNFKKTVNNIVKIIKQGEVVVCPTDTVYGLLVDIKNNEAVKKIFKIKQRIIKKPLPVFVKDLKMAKKLAKIGKKQEKILKKFWPGQLTAILPSTAFLRKKAGDWPNGIISEDNKVGLRIVDHQLIKALFNADAKFSLLCPSLDP